MNIMQGGVILRTQNDCNHGIPCNMAARSELIKKIEDSVIPLYDTDLEAGGDDVQALCDIFNERTIIGLGEATHGTREFFQIKSRLIRLLVTQLDVRIVGFESNFGAAQAINDVIVHEKGSATGALDKIFNIYNTVEVLALVEWLQEFNQNRPLEDRVRFYGFDVQATTGSAAALQSYLETVDPEYAGSVLESLENVKGLRYADDVEGTLEQASNLVAKLTDRFEQHRESYAAQTSPREYELARHHVWLIDKAREFRAAILNGRSDISTIRDEGMADNVEWILDHENREQIVLWGKNGHITRNEGEQPLETTYRVMGNFLAERYGDDYYAVGFDFGRGSFQARPSGESGLQEYSVGGFEKAEIDIDELIEYFSKPGYTTGVAFGDLAEIGLHDVLPAIEHPAYLLDFTQASTAPGVQQWLNKTHLLHGIGNIVDELSIIDRLHPVNVAGSFDALVFVKETNRAIPLENNSN